MINNNSIWITNKTDPNSKIVGVLAIQYGKNFSDFGINLVKGNYPKNKNEIIVSKMHMIHMYHLLKKMMI